MRLRPMSLAAGVLGGLLAAAPALAQQHAGHEKLGQVNFANSCSPAVQADLNRAVALLHSFWWSATIKAFNEVAQKDPSCGIAHWGVAMAWLGQPLRLAAAPRRLWPTAPPPSPAPGPPARRASASSTTSPRSRPSTGTTTRSTTGRGPWPTRRRWSSFAARYPDDREAAIFYALALNATALATDKTYAQQLKAAAHPGGGVPGAARPPGRGALPDPQLRLSRDRREGARRRPALRHHRPGGAARPAHAVPHLHPARLLAGFHQLEPRLGRRPPTTTSTASTPGTTWSTATSSWVRTGGPARARPDPRGREAERARTSRPPLRWRRSRHAMRSSAASGPRRHGLALRPADFAWARFPQAEAILVFAAAWAPPGAATSPRPGTTRRGSQRYGTA